MAARAHLRRCAPEGPYPGAAADPCGASSTCRNRSGRLPQDPQDPTASQRYRLPSLTDKGVLARLAAIGAVVAAVAVSFAYVAGWFSPSRLGEVRFVNRFEQVNGIHPGFRRNHAKGVCVTGSFESNGQGVRLSKAAVFREGRVPVVGRFSLAGGHPFMADGPKDVRALGLRLQPRDGEEWRMAMIDIPVSRSGIPPLFTSSCSPRAPTRQPASRTRRRWRRSAPPIRNSPRP